MKVDIAEARRIARFAPINISYEDAVKLRRDFGPKLDDFQRSVLACMVVRIAKN